MTTGNKTNATTTGNKISATTKSGNKTNATICNWQQDQCNNWQQNQCNDEDDNVALTLSGHFVVVFSVKVRTKAAAAKWLHLPVLDGSRIFGNDDIVSPPPTIGGRTGLCSDRPSVDRRFVPSPSPRAAEERDDERGRRQSLRVRT